MYYILFCLFPSVSKICNIFIILVKILERMFSPNGTHCKLWQVLSVQDDGSVWKKIIKMWERNFCIMTNNISNMRKISREIKIDVIMRKRKNFLFSHCFKISMISWNTQNTSATKFIWLNYTSIIRQYENWYILFHMSHELLFAHLIDKYGDEVLI